MSGFASVAARRLLVLAACFAATAARAELPFIEPWQTSDEDGSVQHFDRDTLVLGLAAGEPEPACSAPQAQARHGFSRRLANASCYRVTFSYELFTWDAYAAAGGFFDAFSVSVGSEPAYWIANWDQHETRCEDMTFGWVWGGHQRGCGERLELRGMAQVDVAGAHGFDNYLTVMLDTASRKRHGATVTAGDADARFPSWGRVTIESVELDPPGACPCQDGPADVLRLGGAPPVATADAAGERDLPAALQTERPVLVSAGVTSSP